MKFLHAADVHLDSPLAGLARRHDVPDQVTRACTRRAFANVIDLAIAEDVAFVLIAGDLFDADWKDFSTGLFFNDQMRRLDRPCIVIHGNHDAASEVSRRLTLPTNVHVLSARTCETVQLDEHGVAVHGRSFPNRAVPEDLSADYKPPVAGLLNIGLLHTSAEGSSEHDTYAPCRIEALAAKGYDYWALGHIHQRRVLHEHPYVVFPGNIQGRNPRETGPKGVTLVTVEDRRIVGAEHRDTDVLRWAQAAVDAAGAGTERELAGRIGLALEEAQAGAQGRPLIARVTLTGATPLHAALLADPEKLDAECRNAAAGVAGELYIERVRLRTGPPPVDAADRGALSELEQAFLAALDDLPVQTRLLDDFQKLSGQIPHLAEVAKPELPSDADALWRLAAGAWQEVIQGLKTSPAQT